MKKLITVLLFTYGISADGKTFELSVGKIESSNKGTLSIYENDISINLTLKDIVGKNLFLNYFIEYNKFDHTGISFPAIYEMYLLGIGIEKHFALVWDNLSFVGGSLLGLSDDQYSLDWSIFSDNEFIAENTNFHNANYTYDDSYLFIRFKLGIEYLIIDKISLLLNYEKTYTNEQYGYASTDWIDDGTWTFMFEDIYNIEYKSIKAGINYRF